ncbi:MAG: hypothetical protein KAS32_14290 [Candidatus Peribacteraceae bacterium]|nr:hypothetical protein [Candidatus Peribacteraceae bacterium]
MELRIIKLEAQVAILHKEIEATEKRALSEIDALERRIEELECPYGE